VPHARPRYCGRHCWRAMLFMFLPGSFLQSWLPLWSVRRRKARFARLRRASCRTSTPQHRAIWNHDDSGWGSPLLPNNSTNSRTSNLCVSFPVRTASSFPERTFAPTATSTCMTEPLGASTRRASLTSSGMRVQRRRQSQPELPRGSPAGFSVNSACSRIAACQAAWPIRPDHRAEALNRFALWRAPHLNLGRPGAFARDGRRHPQERAPWPNT
jgi:hypothetical protein